MIEINDEYIIEIDRSSSKGNQLKWFDGKHWYKADNNGYEGLSEYVVSKLLEKSSLKKDEYVCYELEEIKYKNQIFKGCKAKNFLKEGSQIITLERLFSYVNNVSLMDILDEITTTKEKAKYIVDNVISITGLNDFGEYLYKLSVVDALFLNEDRHTHNIAIIKNIDDSFDYCPIFDNGACLLSDTKIDYPLSVNTIDLIKTVKPKIYNENFIDIINSIEPLYGSIINFSFNEKDIDRLIDEIDIYDYQIKSRVKQTIKYMRNRMEYFF